MAGVLIVLQKRYSMNAGAQQQRPSDSSAATNIRIMLEFR
jgi:hypothetical protein